MIKKSLNEKCVLILPKIMQKQFYEVHTNCTEWLLILFSFRSSYNDFVKNNNNTLNCDNKDTVWTIVEAVKDTTSNFSPADIKRATRRRITWNIRRDDGVICCCWICPYNCQTAAVYCRFGDIILAGDEYRRDIIWHQQIKVHTL